MLAFFSDSKCPPTAAVLLLKIRDFGTSLEQLKARLRYSAFSCAERGAMSLVGPMRPIRRGHPLSAHWGEADSLCSL
jgi:hypothetical protein